MPNLRLIKFCFQGVTVFFALPALPTNGYAAVQFSGQIAAGLYRDESLTAKSTNVNVTSEFVPFGEGNDYLSSLSTGYNYQLISKTDEEVAKKIEFQGGDTLESKTYNFNYSQALGLANTAQVLFSTGKIGSDSTRSVGLGFQRWFLMDRFRGGLVLKKNDSEQEMKNITGLDGKRITTPDRVSGNNIQANLLSYISNTTIGLADVSYTTRNDRPPTWSTSLEARQYVTKADSSLHLGINHYENVGSIQPITTYGSIVANSASVEWHQKFKTQYIWMGGYRFYMENERPREADVPVKAVGSDYLYTTLRYRTAKGWTYRSNEISLSYGHYLHNAGLSGNNISLGVDWLL